MEPMKPMKPMEPMSPMEPMKPLDFGEPWWPGELGQPSSSGAQNGMRYAVFPSRKRLLVEENGTVTTYDTGDHRIGGVGQQDGHSRTLAFSSDDGPVALEKLQKVS